MNPLPTPHSPSPCVLLECGGHAAALSRRSMLRRLKAGASSRTPKHDSALRSRVTFAFAVAAALLLTPAVRPARAQLNHVWNFTNPADYILSNSDAIEIDSTSPGQAQLVLQAQQIANATLADYFATNSLRANLTFGTPAHVILRQSSPGTFAEEGAFTSRIIANPSGNQWRYLRFSSANDAHVADPSLIAWYRFDNDGFMDYVTGISASAENVQFTSDAKAGGFAARIPDSPVGYVRLPGRPSDNNNLFHQLDAFTVAYWLKIFEHGPDLTQWVHFKTVRSGSEMVFDHRNSSGAPRRLLGGVEPAFAVRENAYEFGRWYFIVGTWDRLGDGRARLYRDGELIATSTSSRTSAIATGSEIGYIGAERGLTKSANSTIDEFAVWNRALSAAEVARLYKGYYELYPLRFQVRSGTSRADLESQPFVGDDGTTDTYYLERNARLTESDLFTRTHPFVQYRAFFRSSIDRSLSPVVGAVGLYGTTGLEVDATTYDFDRGNFGAHTVRAGVGRADRAFLGLGRARSGGYETEGTFVSRVFDAGAEVNWDQLEWTAMGETLAADRPADQIPNLLGYYNGASSWLDVALQGRRGFPSGGVSDTEMAKLGARSAVFDGIDGYVDGFGFGSTTVRTIEFWLNTPRADTPLMTLRTTGGLQTVQVANRSVIASGFRGGAYPRIYVNANSQSPRLTAGWNHVAVVWPVGTTIPQWTVGRVGDDYFYGMLDDVAVWSVARGPEQITERYVRGNPQAGGRLYFQVRVSDDPTFDNVFFVGPGRDRYRYFDSSPAGLPQPQGGRYFQYSVRLEGSGDMTPNLSSVRAYYNSFQQTAEDTGIDDFLAGSLGEERLNPIWYGDAARLPDFAALGPPNVVSGEFTTPLSHAWPMDGDWEDSIASADGTPVNNPGFSADARVGTRAGTFDGVGAHVGLTNPTLGADRFTFGLWFRSGETNRQGIASTFSGGQSRYFRIELNDDGQGGATAGGVALVASDGSATHRLRSARHNFNDSRWHHVLVVRNHRQLMLYLDGMLEAAANIGTGFNQIDQTSILLGFSAATGVFNGSLDEAVLFREAVTPAEIGRLVGAGFRTASNPVQPTGQPGAYSLLRGGREDNLEPAIWDIMAWSPNTLAGTTVPGEDPHVAGRWALDETVGTTAADSSLNANHADVDGLIGQPGRFGRAVQLDGSGGLTINGTGGLSPPNEVAVSAWIRPDQVDERMIFEKHNGLEGGTAAGYALGLDAQGRPWFKANAVTATAPLPLRAGVWNHVAGQVSPDGEVQVFVNGEMSAGEAMSGALAHGGLPFIGRTAGDTLNFHGRIDEVLVFNRALAPPEIEDQYRAGVTRLDFQVETSTPLPPSGFIGPDGTGSSFFHDWFGADLKTGVPLGRFFQYQASLATEDFRHAPALGGVRIDVSSYSSIRPTVQPTLAAAGAFPGRLLDFADDVTGGERTEVRYQVSGDTNTVPNTWYYWEPSGGGAWNPVTGGFAYPIETSSAAEIQAGITRFYDDLYNKTGGRFRFRAFLKSDGDHQVKLEQVALSATVGSVTVLFPNGAEVGDNALIAGVPYTIRWSSLGTVGNNLTLELSSDSGATWPITLATGVGNTGAYHTVISEVLGDRYRIRIRDPNNANIRDTSDGDFEIIQSSRIVTPDGGELWYAGETNAVVWEYFRMGGDQDGIGALFISPDDGITWHKVATPPYRSGINTYEWETPKQVAEYLSETARMGFSPNNLAAEPTRRTDEPDTWDDISNDSFIMAGIAITYPGDDTSIKMGNEIDIIYRAAHAGETVKIEFSVDDGNEWITVVEDAACVPGDNVFRAELVAASPSEQARIRISSNTDPKVTGISHAFTLADINIIAPRGSPAGDPDRDRWRLGDTYDILWTAAGAGDLVKIEYSTDGILWTAIETDLPNQNSTDVIVTNRYNWTVRGPAPSASGLIRIGSIEQPDLYATTLPFDFWGVRVDAPNGFETWEFTQPNPIAWTYRTTPFEQADIRIAYQGGATTNEYELLLANVLLNTRSIMLPPELLRRPSTIARVMIQVRGDPMYDMSDNTFRIRGMKVETPAQGAVYTLRQTVNNGLEWFSAATGSGVADLWYAPDGVSFNDRILINNLPQTENVDGGTSWNSRHWEISGRLTPSLNARVKVVAGAYSAVSPPFTMRGLRITRPQTGSVFDIGANETVIWQRAALQGSARAQVDLSVNGMAGPFVDVGLESTVPVGASFNFGWPISPDLDPSTNAVLRMTVVHPETDTDVIAYSDVFTLRGLKMTRPETGDNWFLGETRPIRFLAAGMGAGARATLHYSANGGATFDTTRPIVQNLEFGSGPNQYDWTIEATTDWTRLPATNAVVRVTAGTFQSLSEPFRMSGIKVTRPIGTDIWAVRDVTNTIRWAAVDASGTYDIHFSRWDNGTVIETWPIATGVTGNHYEWTLPADSVGENVTITVTDGSLSGISEKFEIVTEPSIRIIRPAPGDFWKVGSEQTIVWSRGGNMPNTFDVFYSPAPYTLLFPIDGGTYEPVDGMFQQVWQPIPNEVGPMRIYIVNRDDPTIEDTFDDFQVAAQFDIFPFLGDIFARSSEQVSWITRGSILGGVNLYYSTDPDRAPARWVKINAVPFTEVAHDSVSSYTWTVPDVKTDTVWLRVQDANFPQMFPADKPGPFDDLGTFEVKYYQILWNVRDAATSNHLDQVSVSDTSPWSQSGITSPILREYPYGRWDTVWMREYFADKVVFQWESQPSREIDVYMQRSDREPDFRVMANFAYQTFERRFNIQSWIERGGQIMGQPERNTIRIFDQAGERVETLETTVSSQGVFRQVWDVQATEDRLERTFSRSEVFFARVEITFSGVTYASGLTFMLRQAATEDIDEVIDSIGESTDRVLAGIDGLTTNVLNVGTALSDFRAATEAGFTNVLDSVFGLSGKQDDLLRAMETNRLMLADGLRGIEGLSDDMIIMLPQVTNLAAQVEGFAEDAADSLARILTRPPTIAQGSTNTFLYKSRRGFGNNQVSLSVAQGGATLHTATMTEVMPYMGIYQLAGLVANWPLGEIVITCADPQAHDSIVVRIVDGTMEDLPARMAELFAELSGIGDTVGDMAALIGTLPTLTDMSNEFAVVMGEFQTLQQTLDTLARDDDLVAISNLVAGVQQTLAGLDFPDPEEFSMISNLLAQVVADLADIELDDVARGEDLMIVSNLVAGVQQTLLGLDLPDPEEFNMISNLLDRVLSELGEIELDELARGDDLTIISNLVAQVRQELTDLDLDALARGDDLTIVSNLVAQVRQELTDLDLDALARGDDLTIVSNLVAQVRQELSDLDLDALARGDDLTIISNLVAQVRQELTDLDLDALARGDDLMIVSNLVAAVQQTLAGLDLPDPAEFTMISNLVARVIEDLGEIEVGDLARADALAVLSNMVARIDLSGMPDEGTLGALSNAVAQVLEDLDKIDLGDLAGAEALAVLSNMVARMDVEDLARREDLAAVPDLARADQLTLLRETTDRMEQAVRQIDAVSRADLDAAVADLPRETPDLSPLGRMQTELGAFDARLNTIAERLATTGASADQALQRAQGARSEAARAASAIDQVRAELAAGNIDLVPTLLREIEAALVQAQQQIGAIPKEVDVAPYSAAVAAMAETIERMARSQGFEQFLAGVPPDEAEPLEPETVRALNRRIEEMQGDMRLLFRIMEDKALEPIVEETLLGVE